MPFAQLWSFWEVLKVLRVNVPSRSIQSSKIQDSIFGSLEMSRNVRNLGFVEFNEFALFDPYHY